MAGVALQLGQAPQWHAADKGRPFMQTVNFNCPHCGNLMAVSTNLLGRNVRCPHCKQVVQAPATAGEPLATTPVPPAPPRAPAPPPPPREVPTFNIPKPQEPHESIFGERHDEDVFGSEPQKPTMPDPTPPTDQINLPLAGPPQRPYVPPLNDETIALPTPPSQNLLDFGPVAESARPAPEPPPAPPEVRPEKDRGIALRPRSAKVEAGSGGFAWILLSYAALVTIIACFFGYKYFAHGDQAEHPFKAIPDVFGQYEKAARKQTSFNGQPDPKLDVPVDLRVKLGNELRVGDLSVKPLSIDRTVLHCVTEYEVAENKDREVPPETLVLKLRVKNLSADTAFYPNDPAFNRAADHHNSPYTALQFRNEFFYGTFKWPPAAGTKREYVVGHEQDAAPLPPGGERDTFINVAPKQKVMEAIRNLPKEQSLLWRVQLRRGMVHYADESGREGDFSATAVIGVEFQRDQIK